MEHCCRIAPTGSRVAALIEFKSFLDKKSHIR
jgi:hypothetical protein